MATYTGADKAIAFLFDIAASIAADYDATSTYEPDAYAIYDGTLYKCTAAISTPETFNPAHWQAVLVMDEVAAGGGGGGGTTVIANPPGAPTSVLDKLQVESTIYKIPSGGGGSGHTYSNIEQSIGTWIDGKTLYEKTIYAASLAGPTNYDVTATRLQNRGTTINSQTMYYRDLDTGLNLSDVKIIGQDVFGMIANGLARECLSGAGAVGGEYDFYYDVYNNNGIAVIRIGNFNDRTSASGYAIVRYTKTIETTVYDRALENDTDIRTTEDGNTRQTENTLGV
jgi:hypothetical protein